MASGILTHPPTRADGRWQSGDEPSPRTPAVVSAGLLPLAAWGWRMEENFRSEASGRLVKFDVN